jgi:hypothetical protein
VTVAIDNKTGAVLGQVTRIDPPFAYGREIVVLTKNGYERIALSSVRLERVD